MKAPLPATLDRRQDEKYIASSPERSSGGNNNH